MNSVNFTEIFIVNGIGIVLMVFLSLTRIEVQEENQFGEKLFDAMIRFTIAGCAAESVSFVIDGRIFWGCRVLSYLINSFCFIGTCSVGFLFCLYVNFRLFNSIRRVKKSAKILALPLALDVIMNLLNLTGCGIVFTISKENIYERGFLVSAVYAVLFFYFFYSLYLVNRAKRKGLYVKFFPVYYFVVPCIIGTVVQGISYGVTLGWTSVAIAVLFIYIQIQSLNTFVDSLSGLYNRRYMDYILSQFKNNPKTTIYGVMIDVNDFKRINDMYGHSRGDDAIRRIGRILSDSVPENGIAVRYAGDEFIILLRTEEEKIVESVMKRVEQNTERFNQSSLEPFPLSLAMGYSRFDTESDNIEGFLSAMDREMYVSKQHHYQQAGADRRKRRAEER